MDCNEAALLLALLIKRKYQSRRRRYWLHPITSSRLTFGEHNSLFHVLQRDERTFFEHFGMKYTTFKELLWFLESSLQRTDTHLRKSISAEERLAITLRYLRSGCSFHDLHCAYRIGNSTARMIVKNTCEAIINKIYGICMPTLTEEHHKEIAEGFLRYANFPNCIGAVDGKHIRIIKPNYSGSLYYNFKHFFSIVLLAVCDANYYFTAIDVGCYGKSSDNTILENSTWFKKIIDGSYNIPEPAPISNDGPNVPYVLIGDEGFRLSEHVMRPFAGRYLCIKKKVFNYRLTRARRYIESTFGILSNKWRIFHRPLNVSTDFSEKIVKACCLLHNFVRKRDGFKFEDTLNIYGVENTQGSDILAQQTPRTGTDLRNTYADYFMSDEGSVPWQLLKI